MNQYKNRQDSACCYLHPDELFVGVCPLCLNERLLILASFKQGHHYSFRVSRRSSSNNNNISSKSPINFPKIFGLGSLFNRLEFRQSKSNGYYDQHHHFYDASTTSHSQEDSFISIKFEDSGVVSWEKNKGKAYNAAPEHCNYQSSISKQESQMESKRVIEHAKSHISLRWRKRIGHLFQLIRWKRSNKGNVSHVVSNKVVEGVKVRRGGWIRTLTKRRTKE